MPTYIRRYYLVKKINENNEKEENQGSEVVRNSGGKKTTRISGNQLKSKLLNKEIPN